MGKKQGSRSSGGGARGKSSSRARGGGGRGRGAKGKAGRGKKRPGQKRDTDLEEHARKVRKQGNSDAAAHSPSGARPRSRSRGRCGGGHDTAHGHMRGVGDRGGRGGGSFRGRGRGVGRGRGRGRGRSRERGPRKGLGFQGTHTRWEEHDGVVTSKRYPPIAFVRGGTLHDPTRLDGEVPSERPSGQESVGELSSEPEAIAAPSILGEEESVAEVEREGLHAEYNSTTCGADDHEDEPESPPGAVKGRGGEVGAVEADQLPLKEYFVPLKAEEDACDLLTPVHEREAPVESSPNALHEEAGVSDHMDLSEGCSEDGMEIDTFGDDSEGVGDKSESEDTLPGEPSEGHSDESMGSDSDDDYGSENELFYDPYEGPSSGKNTAQNRWRSDFAAIVDDYIANLEDQDIALGDVEMVEQCGDPPLSYSFDTINDDPLSDNSSDGSDAPFGLGLQPWGMSEEEWVEARRLLADNRKFHAVYNADFGVDYDSDEETGCDLEDPLEATTSPRSFKERLQLSRGKKTKKAKKERRVAKNSNDRSLMLHTGNVDIQLICRQMSDFVTGGEHMMALPPMRKSCLTWILRLKDLHRLRHRSEGAGRHKVVMLFRKKDTRLAAPAAVRQFLDEYHASLQRKGTKNRAPPEPFDMSDLAGIDVRLAYKLRASLRSGSLVAEHAPPIEASNRGHRLLTLLGWQGGALGVAEETLAGPVSLQTEAATAAEETVVGALVEPIQAVVKLDRRGIGF